MARYRTWGLVLAGSGLLIAAAVALGDGKVASITEPAALTCSLSDPAKVERRAELRAAFIPAIERTEELENGYAFQFAGKDAELVLDFVAFERDCCTFFSFVIELAPKNGPVTLTMSGQEGTKAFIQTAFASALKPTEKSTTSKPIEKKSFVDKCCEALGI